MSQKTNILYLTTDCNLECDYCYEAAKRKELKEQKTLTKAEIREFIDEIVERETGQSTVVIFGGEPFLYPELVYYTLEYMNQTGHEWGVSITTNGTIMPDHKRLKIGSMQSPLEASLGYKSKMAVVLEISYDASGHDRRVYKGGNKSSREKVEKNLQQLQTWYTFIPLRISYTLHKDNYKNFLQDMLVINHRYRPDRIKVNVYRTELTNAGVDVDKFLHDFKPYARYLFEKKDIVVCDMICGICDLCDRSAQDGLNYLSPTKGIIKQAWHTKKDFDGF